MSKVEEILRKITIEEKVSLCSGYGPWSTKKIERLGIEPVFMSDGPHGPRWMKTQSYTQRSQWDMSSLASFTTKSGYLNLLHPVTDFPSLATLGSSWNRELLKQVGEAIGEEAKHFGIGILLAPGVNIVRHPLCGRAYEYFSEDPVVAGELGSAYIMGVQSTGVGATLKHYVCNNAEFERLSMDSVVEERALREIYLATFELIVKKAHPALVMESYNKVNGTSLAENHRLLTEILKQELGFDGAVISDWWAVNDRVESFKAGMDLEMPQNPLNDDLLLQAVKSGKVSIEKLDDSCRRILTLALNHGSLEKPNVDFEAHHSLARKAAAESIVLLKNHGSILPLRKDEDILVVGSFAKTPRYQGVGCSIVNPRKLLTPFEELEKTFDKIEYAPGYDEDHKTSDGLIEEAISKARKAKTVIIFAGLPEEVETETHDRIDYKIPESHRRVIETLTAIKDRVIVVLQNGSAVQLNPWIQRTSAVLEAWLGGEAGAGAIADVLFGEVNPSGKLAITFPERIEDTPGYLHFAGENGRHLYGEGVFVGYRYYGKKKITPTYPFGYGLSYTRFMYSDLELSEGAITDNDTLSLSFKVTNIGQMAGSETAQVYVQPHQSRLKRPIKELKEFNKVHLEPGESKTITLTLSRRDFAYYDDHHKTWVVDSGDYTIAVGANSEEILLTQSVHINSKQVVFTSLTGESYCYNLVDNPVALEAFKKVMVKNGLWPEDVTEEFIKAIRHNFIPLFKSVTRQTGGKVSREEFNRWMDEVNSEVLKKLQPR
ncbi:glycosyl hydrolase [Candidatus Bathyarchaeota archaeon]|nr:glycosyl hydrolase [Candidatus Bathyarchaeota archaeon]